MTLVKFQKSVDHKDRHYARGDVREIEDAQELIESGAAQEMEQSVAFRAVVTGEVQTVGDAESSTLIITDLNGDETEVTASPGTARAKSQSGRSRK